MFPMPSGVLFLLDEPAAGLSGAEVEGVISVIRHLCQQGNTVFAVEHHSAVVGAADQVIDFGPGAGELGGNVIFRGTPAELWRSDTSTGRWMSGRERLPVAKPWDGEILRWKNCNLPKGGIGALWGPSGCGKTRALHDLEVEFSGGSTFLKVSRLSAPEGGRSARSSVSTYLGFWDILRPLLAETPEAALPRTARAPAHPYRFPAGDGLG